jgi:tRNA (guanine-N7-)-methyltransferase
MTEEDKLSPGYAAFLKTQNERLAQLKAYLDEQYPDPAEITLEIGCGHGHYLTAYAQQYSEANCLGIDLVSRRIRKACEKRDKRGLDNLRFLKAEVKEFMSIWPEHLSIERIFILFPDPWPKKRHTKNRIIQPTLLDILAERSHPGTALHFRTDHVGAFAWGGEVIREHPRWEQSDSVQWPFENPSWFQDLFDSYQSLTAVCLA